MIEVRFQPPRFSANQVRRHAGLSPNSGEVFSWPEAARLLTGARRRVKAGRAEVDVGDFARLLAPEFALGATGLYLVTMVILTAGDFLTKA